MANSSRIEQIKAFLAETPNDPFLHYALAIEYVGLGEDTEAKRIFTELMHNHPDYHPSYYHLAKLHEREGETTKAEEVYEAGIKLCQRLNERHALNELRSALDELLFD